MGMVEAHVHRPSFDDANSIDNCGTLEMCIWRSEFLGHVEAHRD